MAIYTKSIVVPRSVIDENGHANNVVFLQWMQDVAIEHYTELGGIEAQKPYQPVEILRDAAKGLAFAAGKDLVIQASRDCQKPFPPGASP